MKRVLVSTLATSALLTACATETVPACRAPQPHEMAAFSAVISHNENALAQAVVPAYRAAVTQREPILRSHIWGAQGETRGTVIGLLSQPPLCVLDDPMAAPSETARQVLVYPQRTFDRVGPVAETPLADAPPPYGVSMRDYLSCRFEQTAEGWKLADMCGYRPAAAPAVTG